MIGYSSHEKNDFYRDWEIKEMFLTFQKEHKKGEKASVSRCMKIKK
jgi:hypothetical protein